MTEALEDKFLTAVAKFSRENKLYYEVKHHQEGKPRWEEKRVVLLDIAEPYSIRLRFNHIFYFNHQGDLIGNRTSHVGEGTSTRQLYLQFLNYMNSQGIVLKNDFQDLWESNPDKYPL